MDYDRRSLAAGKMKIGPGRIDQRATESLRKVKLKARSRGDLNGALMQAGYYAQKQKQPMFVYMGNSFGSGIWRASYKPGEYLNPINNTGKKILQVTPDLTVLVHDVERPKGEFDPSKV